MSVKFYKTVSDELLAFAVIIAKHNGKLVLCKHKQRETLEVAGGHREAGESIDETAKRELIEETGAIDFDIMPICIYSVSTFNGGNHTETFGKLYYANIRSFETELRSEIQYVVLTEELPTDNWTYPEIQPLLLEEAHRQGFI